MTDKTLQDYELEAAWYRYKQYNYILPEDEERLFEDYKTQYLSHAKWENLRLING